VQPRHALGRQAPRPLPRPGAPRRLPPRPRRLRRGHHDRGQPRAHRRLRARGDDDLLAQRALAVGGLHRRRQRHARPRRAHGRRARQRRGRRRRPHGRGSERAPRPRGRRLRAPRGRAARRADALLPRPRGRDPRGRGRPRRRRRRAARRRVPRARRGSARPHGRLDRRRAQRRRRHRGQPLARDRPARRDRRPRHRPRRERPRPRERGTMSRVLVTGGAGRLGRSVVAALAEAGHAVTSVDRERLEGLPATQVTADLLDAGEAERVFADARPEAVVHLAAIAVPGALPDPDIYRINTQLVWSVLGAALEAGAGALLLASSPTVMGYGSPAGWTPDYLPLDEDHPTAPWNGYAASKAAMEQIVQMAVRQHGDRMRFGVFRPCYVIAPEEWAGEPTQQGHTVAERITDPSLSAVALFNYVDARDRGAFV